MGVLISMVSPTTIQAGWRSTHARGLGVSPTSLYFPPSPLPGERVVGEGFISHSKY